MRAKPPDPGGPRAGHPPTDEHQSAKASESSLHSFQLTLGRIEQLIAQTLDTIAHYDPTATLELNDLSGVADLDADDQESDLFTVGRKVKIELADMDYVTWRKDLRKINIRCECR